MSGPADKIRDAAEEISGLVADLHGLRREVQRETDQGRGSPWHTGLEDQLVDMIEGAGHAYRQVNDLAWDLELGSEDEGDE
jgi:hypothetical protein